MNDFGSKNSSNDKTNNKPFFAWQKVKVFINELIDLEEGLDRDGTIIAIKNNKRMKGANAWLLMSSIMIASLGLDLNSPAVIIGAMLISPLMSPILGIGLGVGINDRETLKISLTHFGIAIAIALATSYFYFIITPFGSLTTEILARVRPTLLDGLVAMFGGLAGIISATRKDQSNAVPGVAIATALMPPLCVSGYGLANGNWQIFLNSFYLFFLNSFFIALTSFIIIRLLGFPLKSFVNPQEKRKTKLYISLFSLILIIPSAIILYDLYQENQVTQQVKHFVEQNFGEDKNPSQIAYSLIKGEQKDQLVIKLMGKNITDDSIPIFENRLKQYKHLNGIELRLLQDTELGLDELKKMEAELSGFKTIAKKLDEAQKAKSLHEIRIEELEFKLDSIRSDTIPLQNITEEAKIIFPQLDALGFGQADWYQKNNHADNQYPILLVQWKNNKTRRAKQKDMPILKAFFQKRAGLDTLILLEIH